MKKLSSQNARVRFLTQAAAIAALYVVLTFLAYMLGLDKGAIQLRFSEALCVLACLTPAAVPGLAIGCFLANLFTSAHILDVIFGSLATLIGAFGAYAMRPLALKKHLSFLPTLPTVLANAAIVPLLLLFVYGLEGGYGYFLLTVTIGELLSATLLGTLLLFALKKRGILFAAQANDSDRKEEKR